MQARVQVPADPKQNRVQMAHLTTRQTKTMIGNLLVWPPPITNRPQVALLTYLKLTKKMKWPHLFYLKTKPD